MDVALGVVILSLLAIVGSINTQLARSYIDIVAVFADDDGCCRRLE